MDATQIITPLLVESGESLVVKMSIEASSDYDPDGEREITLAINAQPYFSPNAPAFLELSIDVASASNAPYRVSITTRTRYTLPGGTTENDAKTYLLTYGMRHSYDMARSFVRSATANGANGMFTFPDLPLEFSLDQQD